MNTVVPICVLALVCLSLAAAKPAELTPEAPNAPAPAHAEELETAENRYGYGGGYGGYGGGYGRGFGGGYGRGFGGGYGGGYGGYGGYGGRYGGYGGGYPYGGGFGFGK